MGSGGKKTFKRYLKSEQTHRHTDGHFNLKKASAQRANALIIIQCSLPKHSDFWEYLKFYIFFCDFVKGFQPEHVLLRYMTPTMNAVTLAVCHCGDVFEEVHIFVTPKAFFFVEEQHHFFQNTMGNPLFLLF